MLLRSPISTAWSTTRNAKSRLLPTYWPRSVCNAGHDDAAAGTNDANAVDDAADGTDGTGDAERRCTGTGEFRRVRSQSFPLKCFSFAAAGRDDADAIDDAASNVTTDGAGHADGTGNAK